MDECFWAFDRGFDVLFICTFYDKVNVKCLAYILVEVKRLRDIIRFSIIQGVNKYAARYS